MGMKVFGSTFSTNVARVIMCLEEVGAEYETIWLDFFTGEHKSPAHVSRNPFGQIPVLQDEDFVIFESRAISRYILRKYKSSLLPENDLKKAALVDVWLDVEYGQYSALLRPIVVNEIFKPMMGGVGDKQIVEENLDKLKKVLEVYEAHLSKCKYLAGDFISFADLSHIPNTLYFLKTQYASLLDTYPHVKAWLEDIMSRPSVKKVVEIMFS